MHADDDVSSVCECRRVRTFPILGSLSKWLSGLHGKREFLDMRVPWHFSGMWLGAEPHAVAH